MPDLQDIELFKQELNRLGDEPDVLARRGERIEDVPVPEEGLSDDISQLLGGLSEEESYDAAEIDTEETPDVAAESFFDESDDEIAPSFEPEEGTPSLDGFLESELGEGEPLEQSEQQEIDLSDIFPADEGPVPEDDNIEEVFETPIDDDLGELADALIGADGEGDTSDAFSEPGEPDEAFGIPDGLLSDEADAVGVEPADEALDLPDFGDFELPEETFEGLETEELLPETEEADLEAFAFDEPVEGLDEVEPSLSEEMAGTEEVELADGIDEGFPSDLDIADVSEKGGVEEEPVLLADADLEDTFSDIGQAEGDEFAVSEDLESAEGIDFGDEEFAVPEVGEEFSFPEDELSEEAVLGEDVSLPDDEQLPDAEDFSIPDEEFIGADGVTDALSDEFPISEDDFIEESEIDESAEALDIDIGEELESPAAEGVDEDENGLELDAEEDFSIPDEFDLEPEEGFIGDDFDEPSLSSEEESADDFESPPAMESLADMEEGEDFEVDEFSLGNLGEAFGVTEEDVSGPIPSEEELNPAMAVSAAAIPEEEGVSLAEPDFDRLQTTLARLPRNLRIVVEELIGEQMLAGDDLERLLRLLIGGASAVQIAAIAGKITGTEIQVPSQYERRTGEEFEAERSTFAYAFRNNILPILRVVAVAVIGLGILSFAGYQLGYRPIYAGSLYRQGYTELQEERYPAANDYFERGLDTWPMKKWFFTYAESYIEKKQYFLAEEKYEQLMDRYHDREGILDYARMESTLRARYEHAEELLKEEILDEDMYDYDALLLLGDNYLEWGDEEPDMYEEARFAYATMMSRYGQRDELLFRMLDYFIRKDNMSEVVALRDRFQADDRLEVEPRIYAKMAGYLIDKGDLTDTKEILFRAMDADEFLPEVHYNLAKYFKEIEEYGEETKALNNTLAYLEMAEPLDRGRRWIEIDTNNRLGLSHYRKGEHLDAERRLQRSIDLLEEAVDARILAPSSRFGNIYANLADIYYYVSGDFDTALSLYEQARGNGYDPPSLIYKMGYINYRADQYEDAALRFYETAGNYSSDDNLLYATANTLYKRSEYFAAQGYYNHLLDILEERRSSITFLRPDEEEGHRSLMLNIMKVYNNLGVTLYKLSGRTGDTEKYAQALVHFTQSNEIFDALSRNPATLERAETVNLAYLNSRSALFPTPDFEPEIYTEIPKDMDMLFY